MTKCLSDFEIFPYDTLVQQHEVATFRRSFNILSVEKLKGVFFIYQEVATDQFRLVSVLSKAEIRKLFLDDGPIEMI